MEIELIRQAREAAADREITYRFRGSRSGAATYRLHMWNR
jgi:hypothetical protein